MKLCGRFRSPANPRPARRSQQGYLLLVILLLLALLMIALVAVAPRIAQQIRRDREEETVHRGTQYVRAIRLFYRKFGRYPTSLDELLSTNRLRFLRKKYKDPLSPNGEWRIIHLGEARVTPTGFQAGAGTASGQPGATPGAPGGVFGQPGMGMGGMTAPGQPGAPPSALGGLGQPGSPAGSEGAPGSPPAGATSSGSTTGSTSRGGAIVGVAPLNNGVSIKELNGRNHYNEWEFVYDPRLDASNRQAVPGGINPVGAPGAPQPGPGTQPTPPPGPMGPPMSPR